MRIVISSFIISFATVGFGVWFLLAPSSDIVGLVVPHHDMVASARQAYLAEVAANRSVGTIVLISPDHFNQTKHPITLSDAPWDTIGGTIKPARSVIEALQLPIDPEPFKNEHGVTSLLADIKKTFPEANLVPVLFSTRALYEDVSTFVRRLNEVCDDCLLIASVDFSHAQVASVAALHDVVALRGLYGQDAQALYQHAEVDSPQSLAALALWGAVHNAPRFELFSHTNSGEITDTATGEMTTHIIGGYRGGDVVIPEDAVTFMVGGDTMFARGVSDRVDETGQRPFTKIGERFFWGVDIALLNLEGVFTETTDATIEKDWQLFPPQLRFSEKFIAALAFLRINTVGLANNHTNDGELPDLRYTQALLKQYGMTPIGDPNNEQSTRVLHYRVGEVAVAVIMLAAHEEFFNVTEQIEQLSREGCRVVVYAHWGQEYQLVHSELQERIAQGWVDAGADLVLGSHPHVVQDVAVYRGVPIVYSLGNFLFDQAMSPETQVGAVAAGTFTKSGLELFLIPISSYLQTAVLESDAHEKLLTSWTQPWKEYRVESGSFFFPNTNVSTN